MIASRRTAGSLALAAVFLVALLPRLWPPAPFLTWDEPTWTYRSLRFARALETGRLAETLQSAHPGVVTMWAGAAAIQTHRALLGPPGDPWRAPGAAPGLAATRADLAWVDDLPPFDEDDLALLRAILPWLNPARAAIALLTAGLVALAAAMAGRLFGPGAAAAAGAVLALDPYLLAHSRVLHLDAVLALLVLASGLAVLVARARLVSGAPALGWLAASGALGGLAFLEKSPGILAAGFAVGALATAPWPAASALRHRPARAVFGLAAWAGAFAAAYVAAWPALWAAPAATFGRMAAYAADAAGGAREAVYFAGAVEPDPGAAFYLAAVALRLTPATTVGVVLGAVAAWRTARRGRPEAALLLGLAALVLLAMGTSGKKFERYALPAALPLDVVAALGWMAAGATLAGRDGLARVAPGGRRGVATAVAGVALAAHVPALASHPHELSAYNALLGGTPSAARLLPIGWGEGTERAVDWLNALPGAAGLTVSTPSVALVGPRFAGTTVGARRLEEADYAVLYVDDAQIGEPSGFVAALRGRDPVHRVELGGVPYAWIYRIDERASIRSSDP